MRRRIPSTIALAIFEAAARHLNFQRTAEELALTQSAVCRQIASLERFLGKKLFHREKKRLTLTDAGRAYSLRIQSTLHELERSTREAMATQSDNGMIELAVLPTFANVWLIPRMGDFNATHPHVTVNMTGKTEMFLFAETNFDAAIHFGRPKWPGTEADYLFSEASIPVCSPRLLKGEHPTSPAALAQYPLLHLSSRPDGWLQWLASEQPDINLMRGARYECVSMLLIAARNELGIALVPRFMAAEDLRAGNLVIPFQRPPADENSDSHYDYYLVYPTSKKESLLLGAFRVWLSAQAEQYRDAAASRIAA
jgi:DNA-binding transcriptional LysR family regulator